MKRKFNQGWTAQKKHKIKHQSVVDYLKNDGKITKCKSKITPNEIQKRLRSEWD